MDRKERVTFINRCVSLSLRLSELNSNCKCILPICIFYLFLELFQF